MRLSRDQIGQSGKLNDISKRSNLQMQGINLLYIKENIEFCCKKRHFAHFCKVFVFCEDIYTIVLNCELTGFDLKPL